MPYVRNLFAKIVFKKWLTVVFKMFTAAIIARKRDGEGLGTTLAYIYTRDTYTQ